MRLGKRPARINSVQLRLSSYLDLAAVVQLIPSEFGPDSVEVGALGIDEVACDVWAGFAAETMLAAREAGAEVEFTAESVLGDYAASTGYTPGDPATDRGSDLQDAASYRRRIGIADATGRRHRVGGYVSLTQGDPDQLAAATYIFGAVGVGIRVPDYAVDGEWESRMGVAPIVGGTYTPVVGRRDGNFLAISGGGVREMSPTFYRRYCDESIVYLSEEFMISSTPPPGFDRAQLLIDLNAFTRR